MQRKVIMAIAKRKRFKVLIDKWFQEPYKTYLNLCRIVNPPKILSEKEVLEWIDPELKHY